MLRLNLNVDPASAPVETYRTMGPSMPRILASFSLLLLSGVAALAGEVRGRVEMPDTCSPTISPAVVTLEPKAGGQPASTIAPASAALVVNQHGLQFEPRVQVVAVGQPIRFTNQDAETHNVHILTPGFDFNRSMAPNVPATFVPDKPGVIRLACDIHSHMRGYVVATASPWSAICKAGRDFRFEGVPDGSYTLNAWHEMGEPLRRDVEVKGGEAVDVGTIALKGFPIAVGAQASTPVRPWSEVTDRIGVLLAEARSIARKPGGVAKARKLAEDAYWGEFESSDMEIAVRRHLGFKRAGSIESQFLAIRSAIKAVGEKTADPSRLVTQSGKLLLELHEASKDLDRLRIHDRRDVGQVAASTESVATPGAAEQAGQLKALAASFAGIAAMAADGRPSDASSAMTDAYFSDFEPLERLLNVRSPQEVAPLEARFNAIRGRIDSGLKGSELVALLGDLRGEIGSALSRAETSSAGSFGPAFAASLVTALREGVEVILLLTMLVALVAKAGQPGAMGAIRWGVGLAVVASLVTAVGLNRIVATAQGRTREIIEGGVMLASAGVLFYVSYWLISQSQAKRWAEFLKSQAAVGAKVGGLGTLALTAFLAVYREGAETALLYQGFVSAQGGSREGLLGLAAGLGVGIALLGVLAFAIRAGSFRLPIRPFFKVTGLLLFAMAVVFAGNGVFALQVAGYIKTTPLDVLGLGIPVLGLHPNVQAVSIQGLLVLGAIIALILPALEGRLHHAAAKVAPAAPSRAGV